MQLELDREGLYQQQLSILETWLKRSGSCPLSISLYREDDDPEISTSAFVDAVVCHAARWAEMELILPYQELQLIKGDMPLLQELNFGPTIDSISEESAYIQAPIALFEHAPNLTDVELSLAFNPFAIRLPWHLTYLILQDPGDYGGEGGRNIINLLNALTLPALRRLEMDERVLCSPDPEATIPALSSFISRICRLEKLRIMGAFESQTFYHELLGDSVSHLYVDRDPSALDG
ncbi:hypothetical protein C8R43DRAFT_1133041 [Mycena crocata]|nr:hypothetical protein C8R43DRAFT_1133041 [Mycena crocata]